MVYYEPVKVIIDASSLAEVIINVIVYHHKVLELIVIDQSLLFTLKFWFSLCYFLSIKKKFYSLFLTNRWPNKEIKQHNRNVFQSICQLRTKQLDKIVANS